MAELRKRRRLTDLYVRGKTCTWDDEEEDPIAAWVQKITPLEQKEAVMKSNAARARLMMLQYNDFDDDQRLALFTQAQFQGLLKDRDEMIEFLTGAELMKMRMSHEAEIAETEEWSEHGYLEGLQEMWDDGLRDRYALNPEDVEAKKCFDELKRFDDQINQMLDSDRRVFKRDYATESDKHVIGKVIDLLIEAEADDVWMTEYRQWNIFFSIREPDNHSDRYFESIEEVKSLQPPVLRNLLREIEDLEVDKIEGKE